MYKSNFMLHALFDIMLVAYFYYISNQSSKSYLHIPALISVALTAGVDAIHPGYGFLSERPEFAEICKQNNIKFIGPSAEAMWKMADKATARICDTHGNEALKVEAIREGNTITVSLDTLPVGAKVLLRNIDSVKSVSGAVAYPNKLGTLLHLSDKMVVIEL